MQSCVSSQPDTADVFKHLLSTYDIGILCPALQSEIRIDGPKTPNHDSRLEKKCFESEKLSNFAPKKKDK